MNSEEKRRKALEVILEKGRSAVKEKKFNEAEKIFSSAIKIVMEIYQNEGRPKLNTVLVIIDIDLEMTRALIMKPKLTDVEISHAAHYLLTAQSLCDGTFFPKKDYLEKIEAVAKTIRHKTEKHSCHQDKT